MSRTWKIVMWVVLVLVVAFVAIQFVPYGRDHANPRVVNEPRWDTARTASLVRQACYDCHSNRTSWPWYSSVAPASWLVYHDVQEGRSALNLSEWPVDQAAIVGKAIGDRAAQLVVSGEMPPIQYRLIHSAARLSDAEKRQLAAGLRRSLGQ